MACPAGLAGLPLPPSCPAPPLPRLNGRKTVVSPVSSVVISTVVVSTAKCTSARDAKIRSVGLRSARYWWIASVTL